MRSGRDCSRPRVNADLRRSTESSPSISAQNGSRVASERAAPNGGIFGLFRTGDGVPDIAKGSSMRGWRTSTNDSRFDVSLPTPTRSLRYGDAETGTPDR